MTEFTDAKTRTETRRAALRVPAGAPATITSSSTQTAIEDEAHARAEHTRNLRATAEPNAEPTDVERFDAKILTTIPERYLSEDRQVDNKASREFQRQIRRGVANSVRESLMPL